MDGSVENLHNQKFIEPRYWELMRRICCDRIVMHVVRSLTVKQLHVKNREDSEWLTTHMKIGIFPRNSWFLNEIQISFMGYAIWI